MAVPQIKYPAAVFGFIGGDPDGQSGVVDYCVASATVTAGDTVIVDTANLGQVKPAAVNSASQLVVGIAQKGAAASGTIVPVVIAGRAIARIATTITAGDRLAIDGTNAARLASITAGVAVTVASALGIVVAVAEESVATTGGTAHVRLVKF